MYGRTVEILEGLEVYANGGRQWILTSCAVFGDRIHRIAVALTEGGGAMQPSSIRALVKSVECEEAVLWVAPPPTPSKGSGLFPPPSLFRRKGVSFYSSLTYSFVRN